jgi:hypothetical protein
VTDAEALQLIKNMARLSQAIDTYPTRAPLLACLADLPDEAWAWLVSAVANGIWPEGFQGADAIAEARNRAEAYLDSDRTVF